jgi:hypothetical protein
VGLAVAATISIRIFRLPQVPFNPAALPATENSGRPVSPIETEERHARRIEQGRSLVELIVAALWTNDGFAANPVCIGNMHGRSGIKERFLSPK